MSDDEEEVLQKPKFVLVEVEQLELLLQHCHQCGQAPGGRKARTINWTKKGTNMTAVIRCPCQKYGRIRWSAQSYIEGTETRTGNLAVTAAAAVAPIGYPDLASFFSSLE